MSQLHERLRIDGAREGARVLDLDPADLKVVAADQPEPPLDGCDGLSSADDASAFLPYHRVWACRKREHLTGGLSP